MNFVESLYFFVILINVMLGQLIFPSHVISKEMLLVNIRDHTRFDSNSSNYFLKVLKNWLVARLHKWWKRGVSRISSDFIKGRLPKFFFKIKLKLRSIIPPISTKTKNHLYLKECIAMTFRFLVNCLESCKNMHFITCLTSSGSI